MLNMKEEIGSKGKYEHCSQCASGYNWVKGPTLSKDNLELRKKIC